MKTITMKNSFVSSWSHVVAIGSIASLALLTACGDDVTDKDPVATQAYEGQEDFPECNKGYEGMFATVKSKRELYICTAERWVNLTTGQAVSDKDGSAKTGCTSKELANKTGVQVICNGDTVATLNYGKDGSKGSPGPSGDAGGDGKPGSPGDNGSNGSDAVIDPHRCMVRYTGYDVVVYDCADTVFVQRVVDRLNANHWAGVLLSTKFDGKAVQTYYHNQFGGDASGTLVRFTGDNSWVPAAISTADLGRDDRVIKGDASVTVDNDVTVSADKYRPFVGIKVEFDGVNKKGSAGLCLTYTSEEEMALLVEGETGFIKATVPASKDKESVYNVLWEDFTPVTEDVDREQVVGNVEAIYVEAVGGETAGSYTNTFSVAQLGYYKACTGATYKEFLSRTTPSAKGTVTDNRQTPAVTYSTVTLGNQTWMAENLRYVTTGSECYYKNRVNASSTLDGADCSKNGRVYSWLDAIGNPANCPAEDVSCSPALNEPVQGICPDGWHLPSMKEWGELVHYLFMDDQSLVSDFSQELFLAEYVAGEQNGYNDNGKNRTGLNMRFYEEDEILWSSTEDSESEALGLNFYEGNIYSGQWTDPYRGYYNDKGDLNAIRCVKDAAPAVAP